MSTTSSRLAAKLQTLGQHANRLRKVVEAAPAQAAQLREAVVLTSSQLQQLRAEVQAGIADLRADTGDQVLATLAEIETGRGTLRDAGFDLEGIDLELGAGVTHRLLLRLRKVEDVAADTLRTLLAAQTSRPALRGILGAILRATELAGRVDLADLEFEELVVRFGPTPTLRIGWRRASAPQPTTPTASSSPPATLSPLQPPVPPRLFASPPNPPTPPVSEPALSVAALTVSARIPGRTPSPLDPPPSTEAPSAPAPPSTTPDPVPALTRLTTPLTPAKPGLTKDWRKTALDRFKKMPAGS